MMLEFVFLDVQHFKNGMEMLAFVLQEMLDMEPVKNVLKDHCQTLLEQAVSAQILIKYLMQINSFVSLAKPTQNQLLTLNNAHAMMAMLHLDQVVR